ncbi:MAG: hypothetical protein AB7H77_04240 [Bdellovibrionales bacterium]
MRIPPGQASIVRLREYMPIAAKGMTGRKKGKTALPQTGTVESVWSVQNTSRPRERRRAFNRDNRRSDLQPDPAFYRGLTESMKEAFKRRGKRIPEPELAIRGGGARARVMGAPRRPASGPGISPGGKPRHPDEEFNYG